MGFIGVYSAVYDYQPQGPGELEIHEGDLLYILEKNADDDWWRAKKKAGREDEDEPEGLVPNNYVEETRPAHKATALFDYTRQTDEEVSFSEDAELLVYDTSDPDWTLVGFNSEYGFAPSNYIEIIDDASAAADTPPPPSVRAEPAAPTLPQRPTQTTPEETEASPAGSPVDMSHNPAAAAIASIIHKQHAPAAETTRDEPPPPSLPVRPSYDQVEEREESPPPSLPRRPPSEQVSPSMNRYSPEPTPPPRPQQTAPDMGDMTPRSPSGYHIYNINEMVEVMGKRKKMPTTLGINMATGIIFISPEGDDRQKEWSAEKLTNYSIEGKHVFVDLIRPSKSIDFHAGAKDTAHEIAAALGEIAGAYRAEGLREVLEAGEGSGPKKGQILYDFMAQGDDEVTVAVGDEVIVLDDTKSEEWWMVRRLKNNKEGVVPSSYVEVTGLIPKAPLMPNEPGLSSVEKNRMEEIRLSKLAMGKSRTDSMDSSDRHSKRDSKIKSKPDPTKVRKWTDRTKDFTVEAQFIGLQDGKIQLHKVNGIKIAVPVSKMSVEDLEHVEKVAGVSLDEDKPLSSIRPRVAVNKDSKSGASKAGASVQRSDYDWFDFFLKAGVGPHRCERYAQSFNKDAIDESVLPDITSEILQNLDLNLGDTLRVMKVLDAKYGRTRTSPSLETSVSAVRKSLAMARTEGKVGRPTPNVQAGAVDPKAFGQGDEPKSPDSSASPPPSAAAEKPAPAGFEDDAWEVKQPKQPARPSAATTPTPPPVAAAQVPQPTGAMADLTLLQTPLQPTPAQPTAQPAPSMPALQPQATAVQSPAVQQPQQTGATPSLFAQVAQIGQHQQGFSPQQTGFQAQARQRPQAPQTVGQNSLLPPPPPPQRPLSAPQNFSQQQNSFGPPPLQAQLTGLPQAGPPVAPPGQSLGELNQLRYQAAMQPQVTGFMGQPQYQNSMMPQPTAFTPQSQFGIQQQQQPFGNQMAPQQTGFQGLGPQPTGFGGYGQFQQPMQTGINSVLPPALQPQPTGANGYGNQSYTSPPPVPPIPQQPTATPLSPQKTGPPPSIRFGVKPDGPKKLEPQPTGLRANLSQATPNNPFGF
ncbi:SLA1 homology domain 1 SHD1 [Penicillium expansum]|nr:SLA1 homology domain 1 SHD1 [Penicillium expansum]